MSRSRGGCTSPDWGRSGGARSEKAGGQKARSPHDVAWIGYRRVAPKPRRERPGSSSVRSERALSAVSGPLSPPLRPTTSFPWALGLRERPDGASRSAHPSRRGETSSGPPSRLPSQSHDAWRDVAAPTSEPTDLRGKRRLSEPRETCKAHLAGSLAVFALTAVALTAGSASAAEPEWGHCVPVKSKGHYEDGNCTKEDLRKTRRTKRNTKASSNGTRLRAAACFRRNTANTKTRGCTET